MRIIGKNNRQYYYEKFVKINNLLTGFFAKNLFDLGSGFLYFSRNFE